MEYLNLILSLSELRTDQCFAQEMIRAGIESVSGNVSDFDEFFDSQKERISKKTEILH